MTEPTFLPHYIDGQRVAKSDGETFISANPATGEALFEVAHATGDELESAVDSAEKGQQIWADMTAAARGRVLNKAAALLREHNDRLAELEVKDCGKPISEANVVDVASAADCLEYFGGVAASLHGAHYDLGPTAFAYTRREPLGVCLGIGAWNYPIQIAAWKAAPALAAGNSLIFKPSELTPATAVELAAIFTKAGLPDGVFNVVHGDARVGSPLVSHARIHKVSLTGSVPTGQKVMAAAAPSLKAVTMELGGKSPLIVFDDAHLDNAITASMLGNFYTQGEICTNATRVFVHSSILPKFLERLKQRTEALIVGDPLDPKTHVGALISPDHMAKVEGYIATGQAEGATLAFGGDRVEVEGCAGGSFLRPTIFTDCKDDMTIVREEIFGPVMSVLGFDDEAEVIERANATEFGLAAGLFTRDIQRAHRVVAKLEAGTCWINNYNITPIEMPFGGNKLSGIGRENSLAALEHYTQLKSVYVELGDVEDPYP